MNISFQCPGCSAKLVMDESMAGRQVRCPKCNMAFAAPESTAPPPMTAPSPASDAPAPSGAPSVRLPETMIANRVVAGRLCLTCSAPIDLGQQVHNCPRCQSTYHEACWQGSCRSAACARALAAPQAQPIGAGTPQKPCPFCGEQIDVRARKCRHCNEWLDGRMRGPAGGPPPPNYLTQSIVVTLLCCMPFGVVAIIKASQVNSRWAMGDKAGAIDAANSAKTWSWVSFGCGLIASIFWIIASIAANTH